MIYLKNNKIKNIEERQKKLNENLAKQLKKYDIKKLRLTSMGNSIASGYSMVRSVKPLLLRNESIKKIMEENNINLERYNFARAQNNNDEHIFEWLETNIKESEIFKINRFDYSKFPTSTWTYGLNDRLKDEYYPLNKIKDMGLKDAVTESKDDLANMIVYNGCSGSFLDGITRKGFLSQKIMYGINRDLTSIESSIKVIQTNNRLNNSNTQIYLCGVPNYWGLNVSEIINHKLKKLASKYANVVYVEPVKAKLFYKKLKSDEYFELPRYKRRIKSSDLHYDEKEYLKLNNNIIESIYNNYSITKALINLDRNMYKFNSKIELKNSELFKDQIDRKKEIIFDIILKELESIDGYDSKKIFLNKAKKYLLTRTPYDFYVTGKKEIKNSIEKVKELVKNLR